MFINRRNFIGIIGLSSLICASGYNYKVVNYNSTQINIKEFGAKGDGFSDDTLALLSALQHLKDIAGGTICIPSGRYVISDVVKFGVFSYFKDIKILGEGDSSIFVLCKGSMSFGGFSNFTIQDMKFVRDVLTTNNERNKYQINMSNFDGLTIDNVTFDEFGPTDTVFPIPGSTILFFYAGAKTGSVTSPDIIPGDSSNFKLLNSRFLAGGDRTVNFGVRIYTEFVADEIETMKGGVVRNCIFDGFNWNAVEIAGPQTKYIDVNNCKVISGGLTGIEVDKGASYCSITQCEFFNLSGNVDVSLYPNTAISGVVLQGDSPGNLVGKMNRIEDVNVYLTYTAFKYPNRIHGISIVDVEFCVVKGVKVVISQSLETDVIGESVSIFISGKYKGNIIEDCFLSGFQHGIDVKSTKSDCDEQALFNIKNVVFSKRLNSSTLFYGGYDACNIMTENAQFTL